MKVTSQVIRNCDTNWPLELLKDYTSIYEDQENINSLTFHEPQPEPSTQANDIDDWVPYEGKIFNSDDDAYNFHCFFARKSGFFIRHDRNYKSSKNQFEENPLDIYKREFVYHRVGTTKQCKVDEVDSQRKRKSSRCNCNAKMLILKEQLASRKIGWLNILTTTITY